MQVQGNRPQCAARSAVPVDGCRPAIKEFLQLPALKVGNCDVESLVEAKPGLNNSACCVRMCSPQAEKPVLVSSKRKPAFVARRANCTLVARDSTPILPADPCPPGLPKRLPD